MFSWIGSPLQRMCINNRNLLVKRDDLLGVDGLRGNKVRKLYYYWNQPSSFWKNKVLVSYGGNQSNAMLALSTLASYKQVPFVYFVKEKAPFYSGNWKHSIEQGMTALSLSNNFDKVSSMDNNISLEDLLRNMDVKVLDSSVLNVKECNVEVVKQGGAEKYAEEGINILAKELIDQTNNIENEDTYYIVLPSGTGTTALYLAKFISKYSSKIKKVIPIPCVGSNIVLQNQMKELEPNLHEIESLYFLPHENNLHHPFASIRLSDYKMWESLKNNGLETDLIYAPRTWRTIEKNSDLFNTFGNQMIYIHTGGIEGNLSQLDRYVKKYTTDNIITI